MGHASAVFPRVLVKPMQGATCMEGLRTCQRVLSRLPTFEEKCPLVYEMQCFWYEPVPDSIPEVGVWEAINGGVNAHRSDDMVKLRLDICGSIGCKAHPINHIVPSY